MSTPRVKRVFADVAADPAQRRISDFFGKPSGLSPALPDDVQANLISAPMRARKAVIEGYKTGSPYSGFKLYSDNTATVSQQPRQQQQLAFGISRPADDMYAPAAGKELLPFCGIHKVGGLGTQPESSAPLFHPSVFNSAGTGSFDDDECPGLTSSQDTVGSTLSAASSASTNRKRRALGEDEEDVDEENRPQQQVWRLGWNDGEVSPKTVVPTWGPDGRVIAVPRRKGARKTGVTGNAMGGQENMEVEIAGDFGEAPFLQWGEADMMDV